MAYITTETVKEIRNNLKKNFPDHKFSVTMENHSSIYVCIMESPIAYEGINLERINLSHNKHPHIQKMLNIINYLNFNDSDPMTDYHHVGYYSHLTMGKYDKPCKITNDHIKQGLKVDAELMIKIYNAIKIKINPYAHFDLIYKELSTLLTEFNYYTRFKDNDMQDLRNVLNTGVNWNEGKELKLIQSLS